MQLTSAVKAKGEDGPPLPSVNSNQAEQLLSQAAQTVQSWDLDGTTKLLDQAKKLNNQQARLWAMYGYVASLRGAMTEAAADFKKEISLHPDEQQVYLALAQCQLMTGKRDDAKQTLQSGLAQGANFQIAQMLAPILDQDGAFFEESKMLEPIAAKQPDNTQIQLLLGSAEMKAGRIGEGSKILVALLKDSTDAAVLNDASYELADKNMDLDLAEASALKALDKRTKDSATLTVETGPKAAKAQVHMLAAVWDTVGWIYFREHKLDAAEGYLRAAWLNDPRPEGGLHLGQLQQRLGKIEEAVATYEMALAAGNSHGPNGSKAGASIDRELSTRIEVLQNQRSTDKKKGDASMALQGLRKLRIGPAEGLSGTADYTVLMEKGHVDELKVGDSSTLHGGDATVKRLLAEDWWPRNSEAKILRQGVLNCHAGICEFVMLPLQ